MYLFPSLPRKDREEGEWPARRLAFLHERSIRNSYNPLQIVREKNTLGSMVSIVNVEVTATITVSLNVVNVLNGVFLVFFPRLDYIEDFIRPSS